MARKITNFFEREGALYARVSYTDSEGKRRQLARRVFSKSEIPDAVRALEDEVKKLKEQGPDAAARSRMTLDEYLDHWLASVKPSLSERTYSDYESILRRYVRPVLGRNPVCEIVPTDVQRIVNEMQYKELSARTVRYAHTVLSSALKYAVEPWKLLTYNPAAYVKLPRQEHTERPWLSEEDAQRFLAALSEDKYGLLFELALVTGMRPEEYLALKWSDLDMKRGTATVNRVLYYRRKGGGWFFKEPKTKKSKRTIPLPSPLVQRLGEYKRSQAEERLKAGSVWEDHNLVFCSEVGSPLGLWNLHRRHFKPLLEKAGLPDIRLYDLRHSCATLLLKARENLKVVSERLGHASTKITADIYQHVDESMQREATAKLESMLYANTTRPSVKAESGD